MEGRLGDSLGTFRATAAFGSWVYRITANAAYQKLRGRQSSRHEVSWEDLVPSFDDKGQHAEVAVDGSRRLKDPAIAGELQRVLGRAIDELPAVYRTVFLLHDVEGLSNPEIPRPCRSSWPRSSRACTGRDCSCGGAWQAMWERKRS
jgi:RNA polymerase sigma-70 factor (ECF subfamily)